MLDLFPWSHFCLSFCGFFVAIKSKELLLATTCSMDTQLSSVAIIGLYRMYLLAGFFRFPDFLVTGLSGFPIFFSVCPIFFSLPDFLNFIFGTILFLPAQAGKKSISYIGTFSVLEEKID